MEGRIFTRKRERAVGPQFFLVAALLADWGSGRAACSNDLVFLLPPLGCFVACTFIGIMCIVALAGFLFVCLNKGTQSWCHRFPL